jgi:hypothetical protein
MMIIILMLYTQVSALCRNQMHSILAEDLASEASRFLDRRRQHQLHHRAASSAWAGERGGGGRMARWAASHIHARRRTIITHVRMRRSLV